MVFNAQHGRRAGFWLGISCAVICACEDVRVPVSASVPPKVVASGPPAWPAWPLAGKDMVRVVDQATRRSVQDHHTHVECAGLLNRLREQLSAGRVVAGWPAIMRSLDERVARALADGRSVYLLFGTSHDAPDQVDAFRRLIGPLGIADLDAAVVEQFDATGHWLDLPDEAQAGDDALLDRYAQAGHPAKLAALRASQHRDNYTAFKYGYLDGVMDLVVTARARSLLLLGCDMPAALQGRLPEVDEDHILRMRELHCALAARQALFELRRPVALAVMWGRDHLDPVAFARFLPPRAEVIRLWTLGGRRGSAGCEVELGKRLGLTAPLLVPVENGKKELAYTLLLPAGRLQTRLERKRIGSAEWDGLALHGRVLVRSERKGRFLVSGQAVTIEAGLEGGQLTLGPGWHPYLFEADGPALAGAIFMPMAGGIELDLDPLGASVEEIRILDGAKQ